MTSQSDEKTLIIIPSLEPDENLLPYVKELKKYTHIEIIVVDDGSSIEYQPIFHSLNKVGCIVLRHEQNQGKGRALKTGLQYIKDNYDQFTCIITVDSDGQHAVEDVLRLLELSKNNLDALSLGVRDFTTEGIPMKSLFGNRVASFVFALLYGRRLADTQTGLRAFGPALLDFMLDIKGERFEYEIQMLIACVKRNIPIATISIQVIYENANEGTHFRPFHDSAQIIGTLFSDFFRFSASSITSAVVDIGIAWKLLDWFRPFFQSEYIRILAATSVARVISIVINYLLNRKFVFRDKGAVNKSLIRYLILCSIIILFSTTGVYILHDGFGFNEKIGKIIVDMLLYFLSYQVQQRWVFSKDKHK